MIPTLLIGSTMNNLFSDDENAEGGSNPQLTINEHYAKAFEYRKEREELERRKCLYICYIPPRSHFFFVSLVKAKYGSDYDPDASGSQFSTDSESAESEDEDGEELTPVVDAAILRTLARIRKKDPAIYDSEKNIYGGERFAQYVVATNELTLFYRGTRKVTFNDTKD